MKKSTFSLAIERILRASAGVTLAVSSSLAATVAHAQQDGELVLDEIVVTAAKRSQTLQDTPIAVSVVSDEELRKAEIQDVFDLQSIVPSLEVRQGSSSGSAGFVIRGFGGIANNAGIESSVGIFVDGIYRSRSSAQISDLSNVERIEVLRGPQSTLFGKNASVGVVSVLTRKPQFESEHRVGLTLGNYSAVRANLNSTAALSENIAYSISANVNQRDGYAENIATGGELNDRDRWGVQGQLLYAPNDTTEVRLIADFDQIDETCCFTTNVVSGPVTDNIIARLGTFVDEDPFSYQGTTNFDSVNEIDNAGVSLHIDKEFNNLELSSITSFRNSQSLSFNDADATTVDIATSFNNGETDTFTQEIRLTSNSDSPLSWLIGASYFDETIDFPGEFLFGDGFRPFADAVSGNGLTGGELALGLPVGRTVGQAGQGTFEQRGQDNTSWSIFANADLEFTDRLVGTFGVSYIDDEKQAFFRQRNTDVFSSLDLVAIGFGQLLRSIGVNPGDPAAIAQLARTNPSLLLALSGAAQDPSINTALGLQPLQFLPPFLDFPNAVESGESSDNKLTYNLRLAYAINSNINVYGSLSTGFKATSFNLSRDSRPFARDFIPGSPVTFPASSPIRDAGLAVPNLNTGTRSAGPEETEVIEIGVKMQYDRFNLNLALFEQTIEGFQSNIFTGTGFALSNAGEQSTTGVEIDGRWALTDGLLLTFSGAFYDPEFDSFPDSPSGDLSGRRPAGISRRSTSLGLNYNFSIANKDAYIRADWQHSGPTDYFDSPNLQALIGQQREFDLVNASAGIALSDRANLSIWGRNIFGEEYLTGLFPSLVQSGSLSGFASEPATYGVTLNYNF